MARRAVDQNFGPVVTAHPRWPATRELLITSMRGVALTYAFHARNAPGDRHLGEWRAIARQMLS